MKNKVLDILQKIANGFLAGMLISIGGAVFLACYAKGNGTGLDFYIGSFLFPIALLCICMKGYSLYTGKIGYVLSNHKKEDISVLLLGLLGNVLATTAFGYLCGWVFPNTMKAAADTLCPAKLDQGYLFALLRAFLCGILVYLAVDIYKNNNKSPLGVLIGIPVFILSGYEHSIADMFYFAVYGVATWESFGYIWMIIIGNSLGALIIPALLLIKPKKEESN